jgi:hypothetical protein
MTNPQIPNSSEEELDEVFPSIAWDRVGLVAEHDFMRRYSVQHRAPLDAQRTLCGALIRMAYVSPGDRRRCARCDAIAQRRLAPPSTEADHA